MPKVSVIIPNYNHARFLPKRIDSILAQTYQDFEIILMDDCSTDNSVAVIETYRNHPKVSKILLNATNGKSTFRQWQKGIAQATGEYVWLAESDDFADPRFLELLVGELEKNLKLGLAYCQSYLIDEEDAILFSLKKIYGSRFEQSFFNQGRDEIIHHLAVMNTIANASAVVFRRKLALTVAEDYLHYQYCGDWVFWITLLFNSEVYYHAEELNYFRRSSHAETNNTKHNLMFMEGYDVWKYIKEKLKPNKRDIAYISSRKAYYLFGRIQAGYRQMSVQSIYRLLSSAFRVDRLIFFRLTSVFFSIYKKRFIKGEIPL